MKKDNAKNKQGSLIPRLRFPEFRDCEEWTSKKLSELIKMIVPPKKLLASEYQENGRFPIIDQSQKYISGWTNDKTSIIDKQLPVIVFGDHTCILKLIEFPFAQGADGIKIFYCLSNAFTRYTYQYLLFNSISIEEYKRHFSILKEKTINYPNSEVEQQRITNCLATVDARIASETEKLDTLKDHKKGLLKQLFPTECETLPRLRFPEFRAGGEWTSKKLSELIKMIVPPKKLLASEYQENGRFPIIDQSQKYISGWTNDKTSIIDKQLPVIVFGDHTCILKLIEFPFAQGADGIKIFYCLSNAFTRYTYQYLLFNSISIEEYKRHFSILKEKIIYYPNSQIEQQRIADCLSSLDELITAQTKKIDLLKEHKKGLMQQLFPISHVKRGGIYEY